jgi:hypothetical protein
MFGVSVAEEVYLRYPIVVTTAIKTIPMATGITM